MAKAKKTKKEEVVNLEPLEQIGQITLEQEKYEDCEWCFQFDNDEPQIFAWTDGNLNPSEDPTVTFTITNKKDSFINFTNSKTGKVFTLFAREISEDGKKMREEQIKFAKQLEQDRNNFEQKIDEYASENKKA
jgi:hypothetical protein